MNKSFGKSLKDLRLEKKLSGRELARRAGISHAYLSQLENDHNKNPTNEMQKKLAKGFGIPLYELQMKTNIISGYKNHDPIQHYINSADLKELLTTSSRMRYKDQQLVKEDVENIIKYIEAFIYKGDE